MEDVTQKLIDSVTSSLAAFPEQRRKLVGNIETMRDEVKENKKRNYLNFLKDEDDLLQIYRLIKNKKLSNNQIRK